MSQTDVNNRQQKSHFTRILCLPTRQALNHFISLSNRDAAGDLGDVPSLATFFLQMELGLTEAARSWTWSTSDHVSRHVMSTSRRHGEKNGDGDRDGDRGEAIYAAIFDSAPSLHSFFKTPRPGESERPTGTSEVGTLGHTGEWLRGGVLI